ncbi:membrane dipeptidase [Arenicella xantha]|uniref:Microsomal dipeptidase-like Zn-dependent dipeptidase n=1 Tax=Arenicella xantha TaxID=644221 RepID=A0A395JIK8_9GAMM|nr:membrane dipeptidase [Arenicella xantha]RBP50613.1 microsomal dipeptidase-like Zn-dependent dipeptidase [Arenicella xantha]
MKTLSSSYRPQWLTLVFTIMLGFLLLTKPIHSQAQPIVGFADLHSHLMAEHTFGGSWYWGTVEGSIDWALRRCDGNPAQSHGAIANLPGIAEFIATDTGIHLGKRRGYDRRKCKKVFGITIPGTCPRPHFEHWPRHDGLAHQQMWHGHLRQAFDGGMKVMVVSLAESNFLCRNTPSSKRLYNCDEMASVHRQIDKLNQFVANHSSWVGIARSPAEARSLASQNKLALVVAVEVSNLIPSGSITTQLDQLYNKGVRSVQLVHHHNNRFSGAAPIPKLVQTVNLVEVVKGEMSPINDVSCGNDCDGDTHLNSQGLTGDGSLLVNAMIDRGMLVDVAHVSRLSLTQIHSILAQNSNYPMFYSHAHLFNSIDGSKDQRNEKHIKPSEISLINATGGMVGLRTGLEATTTHNANIGNYCDGSIRSFAQSLMAGVDQGLSLGFGADLNGFITQMKPRCYPDNDPATQDVQRKGLAHVGLLPQLMQDLENIGVPQQYIDHLDGSAERFVTMWERAESIAASN